MQLRQLHVPVESTMVRSLQNKKLAERVEKEQMKRIVLEYESKEQSGTFCIMRQASRLLSAKAKRRTSVFLG
jgi:hypothetical protein